MAHNERFTRVVAERNGLVPWAPSTALLLVAAPLALIVVAAGTLVSVGGIERHLSSETSEDVGTLGIDPSTVDIDFAYRDGSISGKLPAGVSIDDVSAAVSLDGIRTLDLSGLVATDMPETAEAPPDHPPASTTEAPSTSAPPTSGPSTTGPATSGPATTQVPVTSVPPTTSPPVGVGPADADADADAITLQAELDALAEVIRRDVVFTASSDDLDVQAQGALDAVVALLDRYPLPVIRVTGHTDDRGSDDTNRKLSASRAQAVANYLVSQGVALSRVRFVGAGESQPIADNSTPEGQAENRRVQFTALGSFT